MVFNRGFLATTRLSLVLAGGCLLFAHPVLAQGAGSGGGYHVEENTSANRPEDRRSDDAPDATHTTPRLVRFDYVQGNVTWRPDDKSSWSKAKANQPLHEGEQIWVTGGGRAELRFDDGSALRIGNDSIVVLDTLYNDADGGFTRFRLTSGLATLRIKPLHSVFKVGTPNFTVTANGPARVRIGADDAGEVAVRLGHATIEGTRGKTVLNAGDYVSLDDRASTYHVVNLPPDDSWEAWNDQRDAIMNGALPPVLHRRPVGYVAPPSFGLFLNFGGYHRYHRGWW